jgi:hypothetical protein
VFEFCGRVRKWDTKARTFEHALTLYGGSQLLLWSSVISSRPCCPQQNDVIGCLCLCCLEFLDALECSLCLVLGDFLFRILVARTLATFPPNPSLTLLALFPRAFLVTTTTNAHTHISFACLRFKKNQFNDNINHPRRLNPTTFHFI